MDDDFVNLCDDTVATKTYLKDVNSLHVKTVRKTFSFKDFEVSDGTIFLRASTCKRLVQKSGEIIKMDVKRDEKDYFIVCQVTKTIGDTIGKESYRYLGYTINQDELRDLMNLHAMIGARVALAERDKSFS